MAASMKNEFGTVYINEGVLAKICGMAATNCMGVLGLASADGLSDMLKRDSVDRGVHVQVDHDVAQVDLSVIVKYGVSIAAVAENIIETVKYAVESLTSITVSRVDVVVRGIRVV